MLFHELVDAYQLDREQKRPFESVSSAGLLQAYVLLTGDARPLSGNRLLDAAREPVPSS